MVRNYFFKGMDEVLLKNWVDKYRQSKAFICTLEVGHYLLFISKDLKKSFEFDFFYSRLLVVYWKG